MNFVHHASYNPLVYNWGATETESARRRERVCQSSAMNARTESLLLLECCALAVLCGALSCDKNSQPNGTPGQVPAAREPRVLSYDVELDRDGATLHVQAEFPPSTPHDWWVDPPAMPYVHNLQIQFEADGAYSRDDRSLRARCEREGCRIRYDFLLRRAAQELDSRTVASFVDDSLLAPPSTWLLRPRRASRDFEQRFRVHAPEESAFSAGTFTTGSGAYESPLSRGFYAPYAAFGPPRFRTTSVGGARIRIHSLAGVPHPLEDVYLNWISESLHAIAAYYDGFPAPECTIFLSSTRYHGSQMGIGGTSVLLGMHPTLTPQQSGGDWIAVHELIHVGFPVIERERRWATEGLATYVESIVRSQAGLIPPLDLWTELAQRLPLGVPQPGDTGLDTMRTWASTYWGGALFWFLADLKIHRKTTGQKGLRQALIALKRAGGNSSEYWPLRRVLREMDRALPEPVLIPLYDRWGRRRGEVDLDAELAALGVRRVGGSVQLDDDAPDVLLRKSIEGSLPRQSPRASPNQGADRSER